MLRDKADEITNYFAEYNPTAWVHRDGTNEIDICFSNLRVFFVLDRNNPFWGYVSDFWDDAVNPLDTYKDALAIIKVAEERRRMKEAEGEPL